MSSGACFGSAARGERALAVPHFEQAIGAEAFVDSQNCVLVDGEVAGQLADRGEAVAGFHGARGAEGRDLVGDLPRDGDGRAFFDSQKHGEPSMKMAVTTVV